MERHKFLAQISVIHRALGIIEGVMLLADDKEQQTLATAIEMIDEAIKVVEEDG